MTQTNRQLSAQDRIGSLTLAENIANCDSHTFKAHHTIASYGIPADTLCMCSSCGELWQGDPRNYPDARYSECPTKRDSAA